MGGWLKRKVLYNIALWSVKQSRLAVISTTGHAQPIGQDTKVVASHEMAPRQIRGINPFALRQMFGCRRPVAPAREQARVAEIVADTKEPNPTSGPGGQTGPGKFPK
jgi:hypothetical protein